MDYSKLISNNGMYLYKNSDFNTINISMSFLANPNNRENAIYDLLCDFMLKANKRHSTNEINRKLKELYGTEIDIHTHLYGSKRLLNFCLGIVSPELVGEDFAKEAFELARDILLYPDFERQDVLDMIKRIRLSGVKSDWAEPMEKAGEVYYDEMLPDPKMKYEYATDIEYIRKMYDSITMEDLKALYEKTINEQSFYRGLAFGHITDEEYKEFRELFPFKTTLDTLDFKGDYKARNGRLIVPDEDIQESSVYVTFSLDEFDRGTREILDEILNGSSSLCLNILRDQNALVYNTEAQIFCFGNYLYIRGEIDKRNFDDFLKAVNEIIQTIKDPKKLKPLLEIAKEAIKKDNYVITENKEAMFLELFNEIRGINNGFDYEKFIREIDGISEEDIARLTKSIKRKSIFMYRGDAEC